MEQPLRILFVSEGSRRELATHLEDDFHVVQTASFEEGETLLSSKNYDLIIVDFYTFGDDELKKIQKVSTYHPLIPLVIIADASSEESATEAIKKGKADYLIRTPRNIKQLPHIIKTVVRGKDARDAYEIEQHSGKYGFIVSASRDLMSLINREYVYEAVNDAYCQAHNLRREEIVGRTVSHIWGDSVSHDIIEEYLDRCFAGDEVHYQTWFEFGILGFRYFDVSYYPRRDQHGTVTHAVVMSHDMTEYKKTQELLRESEEKYRTILENIEEGYFEVDLRGSITFFNESMCTMTGYPPEELMGLNNQEYTSPETAREMFKTFNAIYRTGKPASVIDYEVKRKDGNKRILEVSASLMRASDGTPVGFRGITRDVTDRKEAERALKKIQKDLEERNQSLEAINTIADKLYRSLDYRAVIEKAVESMIHYTQSPSVAIFAYDDELDSLELLHARGFGEEPLRGDLTRISFPLEDSQTGSAIAHRKVVTSHDVLPVDSTGPDTNGEIVKSAVSVPLLFQDRVLGVMNLVFKEKRTLTDYERQTLMSIGKTVGLALANAQHIKQVESEISERRKAEEKIKEYSRNLEGMVEERTKELHRALHAAEESRDRIDGILKSVADGLIVIDMYHRITLMNRAAEDLLCVRFSELINRPIDHAVKESTLLERIKATSGVKKSGHQFDFELPGKGARHPRVMRARTSIMEDRHGRQTGVIIIMHDVTFERELDRMKTEFVSTAAHELRTPLTSIQGFSELLMTRENLVDEEKKKFTAYINRQSKNLAAIMRDLLDISRIESGKGFPLLKVSTDVKEIIKEVIAYYQTQSDNHTFEVTVPEVPMEIEVDREKVEKILDNVLGNAVKYSPAGGFIRVKGRIEDERCLISVEDNGIGMTPEQVERIFEKFYRADASNTAVPGTGLGMSIVRYLVEAHDGNVWVESEGDKGTTVWLTLPTSHSGPP